MEGRAVCAPQLAEPGAQNNIISSPHAVPVTEVDKVINNKIDSPQGEAERSEEELLQGLLTDHFCHVCDAVLLFQSQRLAHYEGKRHAQKLKVYLQAKRSEGTNEEPTGLQQSMAIDKERFCELCNMVFSSPVVARSHYEGKVHTKHLRKQGLQPQDKFPEDGSEPLEPAAAATTPAEVDLKDPDRHCALCAASFNNPHMASQHYNGRKHQKNRNRRELLRRLGDDTQQADSLMCKMCDMQFTSVEMHRAHVKGNKHQMREKKVLCKSQQKAYGTFTDELSDYIQMQKARGITPRPQVLPSADAREEDEEDEEEEEALTEDDVTELNKPTPGWPPHRPRLGFYDPFEGWRPPYQGPAWPSHGVNYSRPPPPPVVPGSSAPLLPRRPMERGRRKRVSASSNVTSSSRSSSSSSRSSSSSSGGTSESDDDAERRRGEKRRFRGSGKGREKRGSDEDSDKGGKGNRRQRRDRAKDSEGRRRGESGESEEERRRKKLKNYSKQGRGIKKPRVEDSRAGERMTDTLMPEDKRKQTEVHLQTEMNADLGDGHQDELSRNKYRRDKRKTKEKVDTRTEEEKLWDESILGF